MAKSKNKPNKNKSQPNIDNLKPLLIEETIEKKPPRSGTKLDSVLANLGSNISQMKVGKMNMSSLEFDFEFFDDEDFEEEFEEYLRDILGTDNIQVNKTNLKKYFNYLKKNMKMPCLVTGIDVLDEEDSSENDRSKKKGKVSVTMLGEDDIYNIVEFNNNLHDLYGILVEVEPAKAKGGKNKERLTVPLAQLEVFDPDSPNYELLDNYSIWFFSE
ncbi:MAG: hypothetical protein SXA11_22240 [Cyanobacteriota bacterium]|nr:hypothetical protein [Cyanobacteriota bacterium]